MNSSIENDQALRKAEGYSSWHFERIPDTKGLPQSAKWHLSDCVNGDITVEHITSAIKDDILDVYKAADHRPRAIEWDEAAGILVLHGVLASYECWFGGWASLGRRGLEDYLNYLGDPRFPDFGDLYSKAYGGEDGVDLFSDDNDEIVRQYLKVDPDLDERWVRRAIPRLREKNEADFNLDDQPF
jgi:hypothetical protein